MYNIPNYGGVGFAIDIICRVVVSAIAGGIVGYERKRRQKEAGIRTHCMVAMGAAIFTIVSMYGFLSVSKTVGVNDDISRIAANIVTGVSFLGAGMIFVRSNSITGLTTAAGIWSVSAIGLAFGCGMYNLGIVSTLLIVFLQYTLHKPLLRLEGPSIREYTCIIMDAKQNFPIFKEELLQMDPGMYFSTIERRDDGSVLVKFNVRITKDSPVYDIYAFVLEHPYIKSLSL